MRRRRRRRRRRKRRKRRRMITYQSDIVSESHPSTFG